MVKSLFALICAAFAACAHAGVPPTELAIWPGAVPDAQVTPTPENAVHTGTALIGGKTVTALANVAHPTMTIYPPTAANTGAAMIVFPGGGYKELAIDLEGTETCDWLTSIGVTCVLLKYRVPHSGPYWDAACKCHVTPPAPIGLEDAQRTIGLVRARATELHLDPHKIGVIGYSAGGHLVAATSTNFATRAYPAVDAADRVSCRPDFAIALYPGHLWVDEDKLELAADIASHVSAQSSPTLIIQAEDDPVDDIRHSIVYFLALKAAGVPTELHVYARGGHAFGLRPTALPITHWPHLAEAWLASIGVLTSRGFAPQTRAAGAS